MTGSDARGETNVWICDDCQERWYYGRALCPACGCASVSTAELGSGRLVATTTVRVTPPDVRDENPLGLAQFAYGVDVLAQLPADESLRPGVGDEVRLVGGETLRDCVEGPRLYRVEEASSPELSAVSDSLSEESE